MKGLGDTWFHGGPLEVTVSWLHLHILIWSFRGQLGMWTRQHADPEALSSVDCHVGAEESYFGPSWLPLPLLSLPVTQTPASSMTRGLCLDLAGWLFLPAEETSLRALTHRHTYSHWPKSVCVCVCDWVSEEHVCVWTVTTKGQNIASVM